MWYRHDAFSGHPEAWHKVWGFAGWLVDPRWVKTGGSRGVEGHSKDTKDT